MRIYIYINNSVQILLFMKLKTFRKIYLRLISVGFLSFQSLFHFLKSKFGVTSSLLMKSSLRKKSPFSELFWPAFSRIFPYSDGIRRDTEYLSVLSPNEGKCGKNAEQNNSQYGHFLMCPAENDEFVPSLLQIEQILNKLEKVFQWLAQTQPICPQKSSALVGFKSWQVWN